MCNIAGYVGQKRAAPILIDMIRAQEGINGGFYTGIATLHEGKIYYAKLTGDLDRLLENSDAADLPGNIGIVHSRTKSGGGDGWAHPFVGYKDREVSTAYVANGAGGYFLKYIDDASRIATELENTGYALNCKLVGEFSKSYPRLESGHVAHLSDVMCQLIQKKLDAGTDSAVAMGNAYCEMPAEIVGLMLTLSEPGGIVWSRISKPMFVGFADHGAYLASCPIAFPDDASAPILLPQCASGKVFGDHFTTLPYRNFNEKVLEIDAMSEYEAYQAIFSELENGPKSFSELLKAVRMSCKKEEGCLPDAHLVYGALYALDRRSMLRTVNERVNGVTENLSAPKTRFVLSKK